MVCVVFDKEAQKVSGEINGCERENLWSMVRVKYAGNIVVSVSGQYWAERDVFIADSELLLYAFGDTRNKAYRNLVSRLRAEHDEAQKKLKACVDCIEAALDARDDEPKAFQS